MPKGVKGGGRRKGAPSNVTGDLREMIPGALAEVARPLAFLLARARWRGVLRCRRARRRCLFGSTLDPPLPQPCPPTRGPVYLCLL